MNNSERLFSESSNMTPGGVSSPVRAYSPYPLFIREGKGCIIKDADGDDYIDTCMAYGPLILGHADIRIAEAVRDQLTRGTVFGAPSEPESDLLRKIVDSVPCANMVRLACSGTEATLNALRLARAYTCRHGIVMMNGGFHGTNDYLLARRISGEAHCSPSSEGISDTVLNNTHMVDFNDAEALESLLSSDHDIGSIIMEPVMGNAGVIPPKKNYLEEVRKIASEHDVVLIFDEVITGARLSIGGAQGLYKVVPDICTMGKIIGGGFPIGAVCGKQKIMENFAPNGSVFAAGTFAGNPVSCVAGKAQLDTMDDNNYRILNERTDRLVKAISDSLSDNRIRACVNHVGSMFQVFFGMDSVTNGADAAKCNRSRYDDLFRYMLKNGVYLPPAALEVNFLSMSHDDDAISMLSEKFDSFFRSVRE